MKSKINPIQKVFGGLNITWPRLIVFSLVAGIYTALTAVFVPDGFSFHDIAVTLEWWILFAIIILIKRRLKYE